MLVKRLLWKHDDLGLIPGTHRKSKAWWCMLVLAWIVRRETRNKQVRLAYLGKLWTDERDYLKWKVEYVPEMTPAVIY